MSLLCVFVNAGESSFSLARFSERAGVQSLCYCPTPLSASLFVSNDRLLLNNRHMESNKPPSFLTLIFQIEQTTKMKSLF